MRLAALPLLFLLAGCSDKPKSCTLIGCASGATVKVFVMLPPSEMMHANVIACRNDACSAGVPVSLPTAPGDKLLIPLQGDVTVQGYVHTPEGLKGFQIDAVFSTNDLTEKDGDVYALRVENGGASQVSVKEPVNYTTTTPNGADCPPTCHQAIIDKTL